MSSLASDPQTYRYQSLQIELTSRCNLSCQTCLRAVPELSWPGRDFSSSFRSTLQDALGKTRLVHVQGWGETLLVAGLADWINWFKGFGCQVSFTTNGTLLTTTIINDLLASGLDGITFSMAGGSRGVQDLLRGQGTHEKLWQALKLLHDMKQKAGSRKPVVAVSYLLTPETIVELPLAISQCRGMGIELFAGVYLTHPVTGRQDGMRLCLRDEEQKKYRNILLRANWQAFLGRIRLQLPGCTFGTVPVCNKNPQSSCFIGADGSVAPCVFLASPVKGSCKGPYPDQGLREPGREIFGTLGTDSLDTIWQRSTYRQFRAVFQRRFEVYEAEMSRVGYGMDGIEQLERATKRIHRDFVKMPVPLCCSKCSKMEGL